MARPGRPVSGARAVVGTGRPKCERAPAAAVRALPDVQRGRRSRDTAARLSSSRTDWPGVAGPAAPRSGARGSENLPDGGRILGGWPPPTHAAATFAQANTSTANGYYMRSDHDLARVDEVERAAAPRRPIFPGARGDLGAVIDGDGARDSRPRQDAVEGRGYAPTWHRCELASSVIAWDDPVCDSPVDSDSHDRIRLAHTLAAQERHTKKRTPDDVSHAPLARLQLTEPPTRHLRHWPQSSPARWTT